MPGPGRGGPGGSQRGGIESRQWARGTAAAQGPAGGQWTSQIPASALLHKTENRWAGLEGWRLCVRHQNEGQHVHSAGHHK